MIIALNSSTLSIRSNYWPKLRHHVHSLINRLVNHGNNSSKGEYFHPCITTDLVS